MEEMHTTSYCNTIDTISMDSIANGQIFPRRQEC